MVEIGEPNSLQYKDMRFSDIFIDIEVSVFR
jgi:hypothetical protein